MGFKSIRSLWQHPRQEWESPRATREPWPAEWAMCKAQCRACTFYQQFKMLLFTSSWSVSQLKKEKEEWKFRNLVPQVPGELLACFASLSVANADRTLQRISICRSFKYVEQTLSQKAPSWYWFFLSFPFTSPSFLLPFPLFSKPCASEHIW